MLQSFKETKFHLTIETCNCDKVSPREPKHIYSLKNLSINDIPFSGGNSSHQYNLITKVIYHKAKKHPDCEMR